MGRSLDDRPRSISKVVVALGRAFPGGDIAGGHWTVGSGSGLGGRLGGGSEVGRTARLSAVASVDAAQQLGSTTARSAFSPHFVTLAFLFAFVFVPCLPELWRDVGAELVSLQCPRSCAQH